MSKTRVFALLLAVSLPMIAWSQQADEKAPEKAAVEKKAFIPPGVRCEMAGTCVTKVFYPANLTDPTDLQDAVNMMRTIVEIQRAQILVSGRAIVVKASSEQIAQVEKLLGEIDHAKRRFGAGYRLEVKVSELEGDKKTARTYSVVAEPTERAGLWIGKRVQAESGSDEKAPHPRTAEQSVRFHIRGEAEQAILLGYELELLPANAKDAAENSVVIAEGRATLELGKPTVVASIDVDGRPTFVVEVKATRIKP